MSQGANVEDIDVFRSLKVALIRFKQTAESAMMNADAQSLRTLNWLEGEQLTYWQSQIRKRTEAVTRAKEAVRQKKLFKDSTGRTPSAAQEEKILQAALRALEEAEMRLAATKRAIPKLQKEIEVYRGSVQGLGTALTSDLSKAIAMVERAALMLDEYVNLVSSSGGGETGSIATPGDQSAVAGGEPAGQAQPTPAAPPAQEPGKEDDHVAP